MIKISCFKGRKIALFGLGGSGMATAAACVAGGAELIVWDDKPEAVERAGAAGFKTQDLRTADWRAVHVLILSPGVPLTHPEPHWSVVLARAAGVEIIGDMELFARERAAFLARHKSSGRKHIGQTYCPVIAITGTNGKSTTTVLLAHLLREAGFDVQTGGNIGKPVLALAAFRASAKQAYVLEVSSYQIDLAPSLKPTVGILLNITPDHIDRHGSFKNYAKIKECLIKASDAAIIDIDDAPCRDIYARRQKAGKQSVAVIADASGGCRTDPPLYAWHSGKFWQGETVLPAAAVLHSRHNAVNTLCALSACASLSAAGFEKGLRNFQGLPHRLQNVSECAYRGVKIRFINDSKATNAESVAPALQSFKNIYWLAGGRAKDGGIKSLMRDAYMAHIQGCYFFGEAAAEFEKTAHGFFKNTAENIYLPHAMKDMRNAFLQAAQNVHQDIDSGKIHDEAVILLSPACASFDQFKNFEERGKAFIALAAEYCGTAIQKKTDES